MSNDLYLNIMFFLIFILMMIITTKVLLALNFEKMFKQGKVTEIRVAFIITTIVISYLVSKCVVELSESIINIVNNLI